MQRSIWRVVIALGLALGIVAACGEDPPPTGDPILFIGANPAQINDRGESSVLSISATNEDGTPGAGTVSLMASAGVLGSGTSSETVTLAGGKATTSLTCDVSVNSNCTGTVTITGTWNSATTSATVRILRSNTGTDAGTDGGRPDGGGTDAGTDGGRPDSGTDGGRPDSGTDGGTTDGGASPTYTITIQTEKQAVVANTTDQSTVTARVTRTVGGAPVPGVLVDFGTSLGSFEAAAGTTTTQATTDAAGNATVTLHVAGAAAGKARITATHEDATGVGELTFAGVSSVSYVSGSAKPLLGVASSGRETSTDISFKVINSSNQPVPNISVSFEVSGVAGASITPTVVTNSTGVATATLRSGDAVGVVIATATVTATIASPPKVTASHPGTPIVGGKPSDSGLQVNCVAKVINAAVSNPPPSIATDCIAKLVDRFSNPVGLSTAVSWFTEAGSISSPVNSKAQVGSSPAADTGEAKTTFSSNGRYPPYAVTPLPGEKFETSATDPARRNPRDMAVTVIAVVAGEETFVDGSGTGPTSGQINGRWDPGEWFTDLGEPLVDLNDNGVWDPGEAFIDTERIDCANPSGSPTTNGRWDGPNGCWDANTQIWRPIHIAYSGNIQPTLTIEAPPPGGFLVPADGGIVDVEFFHADPHLIRMSDGGTFAATKTGTRGSVAVVTGLRSTAVYGGFNIDYQSVEYTTLSDGGTLFGPPCDIGKPTPDAGSDTSPVATRCARRAEFTFPNYYSGIVRLTGATTPQPPPPDGGPALPDGGAPPVQSTITITGPGGSTGTFDVGFE